MWQNPNPIDLLFFGAEHALRRLGVPGFCGCMELWLDGRVDIARLHTAVAALGKAYPVLNAQLETNVITGLVRWRLPGPAGAQRVRLHVHDQTPTEGIESLVNAPRDPFHDPPLAFHLYRGMPDTDVLTMFWTHALMDGGGGLALLAALNEFYTDRKQPAEVFSRNDESRRDFDDRLMPPTFRGRLAALTCGDRLAPPDREARQLVSSPYPRHWGRMRIHRRRIGRPDFDRVEANAAAVGGGARLSDWLRTSALAAIDAILPTRRDRTSEYTMLSPVDHREGTCRPVCWNFNSALPLRIATADLADRAAVARELRRQMTAHREAQTALHDALRVWLTTRLPTAWVGSIFRSEFIAGRKPRRAIGPRSPLSMPFGIMLAHAAERFCGQPIRSATAYRVPLPQPGFAIDTTLGPAGLEITGTCIDGRAPLALLETLVDRFIAFALEPAEREAGRRSPA